MLDTLFSTVSATICKGSGYTFNGMDLTEPGEYQALLVSESGCDSIVTLTLNVLLVSETTIEAAVCAGNSYEFNGEQLTESGEFTAVLTNASGCDSTITLTLTVLPVSETTLGATICAGEGYVFNGAIFTESGEYTAVLTNETGCDSTVTLVLTVLPASETALEAVVCNGETYEFNGELLAESGEYTAVLTNAAGCDSSTITLTLTVLPAFETQLEAAVCAGETYEFNGEPLTESGEYMAVLTSAAG
ncbi:MAG: hypothetical protein R3E60_00825 [Alphaproteobacteria bacterium]